MEDPDLESDRLSDVEEAFLVDSLVEVIFSDWLIFTACKTTMVRISTANTIRVDVFLPFFMVRLDLQVVSLGLINCALGSIKQFLKRKISLFYYLHNRKNPGKPR
jgi:hypothetical protein